METGEKLQPSERRARLHGMWNTVAGGWDEHATFVESRGAGVSQRLLERSMPQPGERVLELGCGPGDVGIAAAEYVGEAGEVVLSDVAPAMVAIATRRAGELGLRNTRTRVLDLEEIDEPDASYDVVVCREAIMLVGDPALAAREIRRVLRPGGRVALTVWGPRERNPWLGIVFDSVSAELGTPMPPPGVPGPFSLDDAGALAELLVDAGFADVEVGEVPTPYHAASVDEWWTRTAALAGPLAQRLAMLPEPAARALRERATAAVGAYRTSPVLEIPGVSLLASASRG
jgi:ubiquinone/menaquinone biosynthesis C-methylase UbiE